MSLTAATVQRTVRAVGNKGKTQPPGPPVDEPAPSTAPLALLDLAAGYLGVFFELCFADKRLVEICRELKITTPGYRLEALPPDQVARVLADEFRAAEEVRPALEKLVREALRWPLLEKEVVTIEGLDELVDLVYQSMRGDPLLQLARVAWRCLLDTGDKRLTMAQSALEDGVQLLDTPMRQQGNKAPDPTKKEARAALKQAERAEKDREAMKAQLADSRMAIAERDLKLAEQNIELRQLRAEVARVSAELQRLNAAGEGRALSEARRSADEARSLAEKLRVAQEELSKAEERADVAERKLSISQTAPAPRAAEQEEELPSAEEASEFLVPVLTREFYDSIEKWDRRIKRATFEKIHLLAQNWRHGSLRALPLEQVPGFYRIRIATDVRLIYRREGGQLEILSLIDREDLDRYIRQARTRQGEQRGKSEAPDAR